MSSPFGKNILLFRNPKSALYVSHPRPTERGVRDRHERGARDAMDGRSAKTRAPPCGRRSRVVLTPLSRFQVGGDKPLATVAIERGSPGRARSSCNTIVRGMPGCSGVTVVTMPVRLFFCRPGCGRVERPAFPAPSLGEHKCKTRAKTRRENADSYPSPSLRGATGRSNDGFSYLKFESARWVKAHLRCALHASENDGHASVIAR
jgi:hypothetical protein